MFNLCMLRRTSDYWSKGLGLSNTYAIVSSSGKGEQALYFTVITKKNKSKNLAGRRIYSGSLERKNNGGKAANKGRIVYTCDECGEDFPNWLGQCRNCESWNTLKAFKVPALETSGRKTNGGGAANRAVQNTLSKFGSTSLSRKSDGGGSILQEPNFGILKDRGAWIDSTSGPELLSVVQGKRAQPGSVGQDWRLPLAGDLGMQVSLVLGGGLVPGSVVLLGGDPGVGKSTLVLQMLEALEAGAEHQNRRSSPLPQPQPQVEYDYDNDDNNKEEEGSSLRVLYVSGEESTEQIADRADRLGLHLHHLYLYSATNTLDILAQMALLTPDLVVVDSIQTVYLEDVSSTAGSVSQVRECAAAFSKAAKRAGTSVLLVGHVTKTGDLAGPRVLEHIVDVVLFLEGEGLGGHRLLRGVKNRYGATSEVAVLTMGHSGLAPVLNPSALFLSDRIQPGGKAACGGAAVTALMEGSRAFLLEVQALCTKSSDPRSGARRNSNGVPFNRLVLLLAVLGKQAKLKLHSQDVFVNVTSGITLSDPSTDLAVVMAVASSFYNVSPPVDMIFIGEVGLGGEIRAVPHLERRLKEASRFGFRCAVVPKSNKLATNSIEGMRISPCDSVEQALKIALPEKKRLKSDETEEVVDHERESIKP
mmetsp:Transcript_27628/g.38145  ORF Transcript_27628/g.38145 Transcript_27628/m.38145 type:complete len:646 (+) Transcript_27628:40-1977(+)|eukprot:CAMPEP_0196570960 /NCGR_PEP_ID=MMETSP1081-20130531/1128_1 /TAXON_ID=36882 /ORGANISM="Pyramimonas amylifera, Strain CCMP720" /LENGTH=645 /DNA_ID=CAMNT_0041887677 /DNA_START=26 /DNA_END=1963 /DNA_ORIENTATION=-